MATPTSITTVSDFVLHIATEDIEDVRNNAGDLRTNYHAAISLYSVRDWVCQQHANSAWTFLGTQQPAFAHVGDLENSLVRLEPSFEYVIDIANAVKHRVLKRKHTNLPGAAQSQTRSLSRRVGGALLGSFRLNTTRFNEAPTTVTRDFVILEINGSEIELLPHLEKVLKFWTTVIHENGW